MGTHSGNTYRLGDKVRIEVLQVNISDVSIVFIMAGENAGVREHIRQQLLMKQKPSSGFSSKRAALSAETQKKKHSRKGAKNKEAGRRSAKHGKPAPKSSSKGGSKSGKKSRKKNSKNR